MTYVHGYTDRETRRLLEQSLILEELLHSGTRYNEGSRVLEAGCGVGAQTLIIARRNPGIELVSMDISLASVSKAESMVHQAGYRNVTFLQGDIYKSGFGHASFDHIFVCFLLEHLSDPLGALLIMKSLLRKGGTITVIEGDHGTGVWSPETEASRLAWDGLIRSQLYLGHDPFIGRRLFPLLDSAGFRNIDVTPRPVYSDRSNPELLDGVVNRIITPMVLSAGERVMGQQLLTRESWEKGLKDISSVASTGEGSFFYSWFKGCGTRL